MVSIYACRAGTVLQVSQAEKRDQIVHHTHWLISIPEQYVRFARNPRA